MSNIDALSDKCRDYLAKVAGDIEQWSPSQIADRVNALVDTHDAWRECRCLNMNPAESLMSKRCRALLSSDMATRLTEGVPGDKLYPHGHQNDFIDEIEAIIIALTRCQFDAKYVEWRPVSTTMANAAVFHALLAPGDVILSQDEDGGGNYAYHRFGPAGLVRAEIVPIPRLGDAFELDLQQLSDLADRLCPKMIVVGGSNVLFPYPVSELREITDRVGAVILYDAAHLGLLISAGNFQRPLAEGAHVVTLSTAKIIGGPVGGMVLTNEPHIADKVIRLTFPGLIQTRDLNKFSALAVALAENQQYGRARAQQSVANAQALARALESEGFDLIASERGYTQTHQLFLKVGSSARLFESRCNAANIMLTDCALSGDMAHSQRNGIRIGTHELTRLGMKESEMEEIARFIHRAVDGEDSRRVAADVESLVGRFRTISYSFDNANCK
jgi:glycine hydroxymethyltransferase